MTAAGPSFLIRPMLAADLDPVLALAAACSEAPRWTAADYTAYFDPLEETSSLRRAAFVTVCPENPATILGFAAATLRPDPAAEAATPPPNLCELDSIAVLPSVRRRGLGAALLHAVLGWAVKNQARRLVLEVRASNAAALALYRRLGFRDQGRRPRYYAHPEEDVQLLGMPVTPVYD